MKLPGSVLSDFLANGVGSAVLQFRTITTRCLTWCCR